MLFRSFCPSPSSGYPFWLLALTFRSSRPAFCGRLTSPVSLKGESLKNFATLTLLSLTCMLAYGQPNEKSTPEIEYCQKTIGHIQNKHPWLDCLYSMGEVTANQVKKHTSPEDFSKYAKTVSGKCRALRKELEREAGGAFPGHDSPVLSCNLESWATIRNEVFKSIYQDN